jgi:hypothetical protein
MGLDAVEPVMLWPAHVVPPVKNGKTHIYSFVHAGQKLEAKSVPVLAADYRKSVMVISVG